MTRFCGTPSGSSWLALSKAGTSRCVARSPFPLGAGLGGSERDQSDRSRLPAAPRADLVDGPARLPHGDRRTAGPPTPGTPTRTRSTAGPVSAAHDDLSAVVAVGASRPQTTDSRPLPDSARARKPRPSVLLRTRRP